MVNALIADLVKISLDSQGFSGNYQVTYNLIIVIVDWVCTFQIVKQHALLKVSAIWVELSLMIKH